MAQAAAGFSDVVEAEGHLIDSQILNVVFDTVVKHQASFDVLKFTIGRSNDEPSFIAMRVSAASEQILGDVLEELVALGCRTADRNDAQLRAAIDKLASELRSLREAPVIDPYNGPALLMEEAAGVFFHETVGHRLEGERQNDEKEGRTFKGQVGKRVLPEFLSVIDDPSAKTAARCASACPSAERRSRRRPPAIPPDGEARRASSAWRAASGTRPSTFTTCGLPRLTGSVPG